jgi:hypothetical protein
MSTRMNLAGTRFGKLVAVESSGTTRKGNQIWRCRCDCGTEVKVVGGKLRSGHTRSCGCLTRAARFHVPASAPARLARLTDRSGECWVWRGSLDAWGYGRMLVDGGYRRAHRVAWIVANGEPPEGLLVLHRCDNRRCVNPAHLFLGTNAENMADMRAKGRSAGAWQRGAQHPCARLTEADVIAIRARRAAGEQQRQLAKAYGVGEGAISQIVRGKTWAHLEG